MRCLTGTHRVLLTVNDLTAERLVAAIALVGCISYVMYRRQ
jgi:hypothetical protein